MFGRSIVFLSATLSMSLAACSKAPPVEAKPASPSSPSSASVPAPTTTTTSSSSAPRASASASADPVVATRDVCALVTKEEIKQATGLEVRKLEPHRMDEYDGCDFRDVMGRSDYVAVFRTRLAFEKSQRDSEALCEAKAVALEGVGDDAWIVVGKQMGLPSIVIGVRKQSALFTVAATTAGGEAETKALRKGLVDLAKLIAKKL